jgi:hypothetical protein
LGLPQCRLHKAQASLNATAEPHNPPKGYRHFWPFMPMGIGHAGNAAIDGDDDLDPALGQ